MNFTMTREWLERKLKEMDEAGVDEFANVGLPFSEAQLNGAVIAKMRCNGVAMTGSPKWPSVNVQLGAVYSNDPESENRAFSNATPSASVNINIDPGRPAAHAFELGSDYYVYFVKLGEQRVKYLRDGVSPMSCEIFLCHRDGSDPIPAQYDSKDCTLKFDLDGKPWHVGYGSPDLANMGYTHFYFPDNS